MAVSLTPQNKQTLKRLLKTGRWNNESEIVRAAIHAFDQQVQSERLRDLTPLPTGTMEKIYLDESKEEHAKELAAVKGSVRKLRRTARRAKGDL